MHAQRGELIDRCLEYLIEHGVADLSLRPLAKEVGTSARMLIYHFGSREGLLTAVMDALHRRLQASFADIDAQARASGGSELELFWRWASNKQHLRHLRVLFEVQTLAWQRPKEFGPYLQRTSESWLAVLEPTLPPKLRTPAVATLCAAVVDGLLLELLSTGDRRRTTDALLVFGQMMRAKARPK